ncbi:hypothetical protein FH972_025147 [Carpinus fangiana]|uniref:mitochondrial processing peptidase n=1 Tax=Carpinus fangiana TaxID=176857 RepID=A0A5N6L0H8_9ROSI|nr:hypothetical protein FH972_025147 [Carpinus fangiana]
MLFLLVAWNAATLVALGTAALAKAERAIWDDSTDVGRMARPAIKEERAKEAMTTECPMEWRGWSAARRVLVEAEAKGVVTLNAMKPPSRATSGVCDLPGSPTSSPTVRLPSSNSSPNPISLPPLSATPTMASRALALSLRQASRTRSALNAISPITRGFATPVSHGAKTECTTLSNGFTIATEHSPWAQTSTVGVWIDAGSRAETDKSNGTAHFLEHLAFKGTTQRTQHQLELEIENMGGHLNAYTSRENTVYYAKSFNSDVPATVDILADILQHSKLEESAVERERDVILREQEEVDKQMEEVVFDHLHATAFQGQPLGRTILGPKKNIQSITRDDLVNYIKTNYTADRMVLVGAGGVPHDELVKLAEKYFAGMPSAPTTSAAQALAQQNKVKPHFVGSEVRVRDDTMSTANIAIAVEGVSWSDDDYFTALVTQAIVGNWDRAMGQSPYMGSKLSTFIHNNGLANSFMSFSTSYSDTGLWGIYLVSDNVTRLDDLVHFTLREWSRLSYSVSPAEVERAKAQLKASILLSLDGTTAVAEDIGRQIVTTGRRMSPEEVERVVGSITEQDVMRFCRNKLWDRDIALSAIGKIVRLLLPSSVTPFANNIYRRVFCRMTASGTTCRGTHRSSGEGGARSGFGGQLQRFVPCKCTRLKRSALSALLSTITQQFFLHLIMLRGMSHWPVI